MLSIQDLMKNPEKYGFCSFAEFRKNKDRWRFNAERIFEVIQGAGSQHKKRLKKLRFEIAGHKVDSLEKVQRIAKDEGLAIETLDFWPEIIDLGGEWCDILVKFMTRAQVQEKIAEIQMQRRLEALA